MPSKSMEVHTISEVQASSHHEESESADKMENVTIFAPQMSFQQKEPQGIGLSQRIYQEESEDAEMMPVDEPPQKHEGEEEDVTQIINAHHFANVFLAKAYQPKNIKVLKRAYRKHLK
jgi:hypothetical protein